MLNNSRNKLDSNRNMPNNSRNNLMNNRGQLDRSKDKVGVNCEIYDL